MIVQVEEGKLRGLEKKSILTGQPYFAFLGIPYAKPPIGDLRFKAPVPVDKWIGIRNATKEGGECYQAVQVLDELIIRGTEDCLYLNIYTPEASSEMGKKKAVMFYIHGGGFHTGSGSAKIYGPDFLLSHDIVLVTLNYRLHVFGFLNTGTPSCPGNAGLKDQLLALKWVKKNITSFGGDPENITVLGESAGATSTHLLMLSPASKGLFKRAIMQSGTALSPWAIQKDPELQALKIGELAGYTGHSLDGLVEHLKSLPAKELCELAEEYLKEKQKRVPGHGSRYVFIPSVENIKNGAFLPLSPQELMEIATPIPAVFGFADQEGLLFFLKRKQEGVTAIMNDLSRVVKDNFNLNESEQVELLEKIKEFYFDKKSVITRANFAELVNLQTDLYFLKFYEAIDYLIQSNTPPYLYLFAYDGKSNFLKSAVKEEFPDLNVKGASHADELGYLFSQTFHRAKIDETDAKVINHCCILWTDFAKTGHPTISLSQADWKPHTVDQPCYLKIDKNLEVCDEKLLEKRFDFWRNWSMKFKE